MNKPLYLLLPALMLTMLPACASVKTATLELMPAPDIYSENNDNPFNNPRYLEAGTYDGILYVTNRQPAAPNTKDKHYSANRAQILRVGASEITYSGKNIRSEELRKISILKKRITKYPLQVTKVDEFGYLQNALPPNFILDPSITVSTKPADLKFAMTINKKLAVSNQKDIFIFVHGYRSVFDNPILLASELWHFMGYDGVFIAFSWPTKTSRFSYLTANEKGHVSGHDLRLTLEYLSKSTNVERIHIIGYSAGTGVVLEALHQIALKHGHNSKAHNLQSLKLGNVAIIGSDYDRALFGTSINSGLLNVVDSLNIYMSRKDKAMRISEFIFNRPRLGQLTNDEYVTPAVFEWLKNSNDLFFVNVSDAEKADTGNGHGYFRKSPWASSDLLLLMKYGASPIERGLVSTPNDLLWNFTDDYPDRLKQAVRASTYLHEESEE